MWERGWVESHFKVFDLSEHGIAIYYNTEKGRIRKFGGKYLKFTFSLVKFDTENNIQVGMLNKQLHA